MSQPRTGPTPGEKPGRQSSINTVVERCERCQGDRPHRVTLVILTENDQTENAGCSRQPYRVTECQSCSVETKERLSNP